MKIRMNGAPLEVEEEGTVSDLLALTGLDERPVVVERNGLALFERDHAVTVLEADDVIEVVQIAAGG